MDITKITIDYLTNRRKKYSIGKAEPFSLTDFEFYKPRLFKLTNQLLNSETPPELLEDINATYTAYIKSCIEYFKAVDTCYLIQKDHASDMDENVSDDIVQHVEPSMHDMNEMYPRNIKPVHYDITKFVTKVKNKSFPINTPMPRTKEVLLESGELKYKDCGTDSNILINQDEVNEHSIDIVLPYSYFEPLAE